MRSKTHLLMPLIAIISQTFSWTGASIYSSEKVVGGYQVLEAKNHEGATAVEKVWTQHLINITFPFDQWKNEKFVFLQVPEKDKFPLPSPVTYKKQPADWTQSASDHILFGHKETWSVFGSQGETPNYPLLSGRTATITFCECRKGNINPGTMLAQETRNMYPRPLIVTYDIRVKVEGLDESLQWTLQIVEGHDSKGIQKHFPIGLVPYKFLEQIKKKLVDKPLWSIAADARDTNNPNNSHVTRIPPLKKFVVSDVSTGCSAALPLRLKLTDSSGHTIMCDTPISEKFFHYFWTEDPISKLKISEAHADSIRKGRLLLGMTEDEVLLSWGKYKKRWTGINKHAGLTILEYEKKPATELVKNTFLVVLKDGVVVNVVNNP